MSVVKGVVSRFSTKQNINGKSSTEHEMIGVDNTMDKILWLRYFIEIQGYNIAHKILMQDNNSAMILEKWQVLQFQADQTHQGYVFLCSVYSGKR